MSDTQKTEWGFSELDGVKGTTVDGKKIAESNLGPTLAEWTENKRTQARTTKQMDDYKRRVRQ